MRLSMLLFLALSCVHRPVTPYAAGQAIGAAAGQAAGAAR